MTKTHLIAQFRNGRQLKFELEVDPMELPSMTSNALEEMIGNSLAAKVGQIENGADLLPQLEEIKLVSTVNDTWAEAAFLGQGHEVDEPQDEVVPSRRAQGCKSLLAAAHRVLPRTVQEEALDEWLDEIECAASQGKPVLRRTISILCRALPVLAVRSRLPARARGGGS
jgi:hypothetical protein